MILTLLAGPQDETTMPPPISALTTPYTSAPLPLATLTLPQRPQEICLRHHPQPCHLPSSRFHITSMVYGGLLAYTINAIKEIC
ncbi:hypothetical protein O181_039947 [Austropuccinia psidii MF-1]|uniref:Uncharacterized protein n=1 Tax=Austropuccinia psidii MF-1 TaxID=1389203 RepID=A0A9Q3HDD9_9BASI|nr:hypothetical protein [Austropuccinia psidii MF-1]